MIVLRLCIQISYSRTCFGCRVHCSDRYFSLIMHCLLFFVFDLQLLVDEWYICICFSAFFKNKNIFIVYIASKTLMATLSQLVSPSISFCICFRTESLAQSFFSSQVFFLSPFMSAVQHMYRNLDTRIPALHTHTHPFNGPFSETTRVSQYQKGKTSLDFTEARDSDWQWHQLGCMQVCISLQTDNHSVFYRAYALPAAKPTVSKHWRHLH